MIASRLLYGASLDRSTGVAVTHQEVNGTDVTVTAKQDSAFSYDHLGNQSNETTTRTVTGSAEGVPDVTVTDTSATTHSYDGASHPLRVSSSDGSWVEYLYDGLDRMVRRQEHKADGTETVNLFFHDGTTDQIAVETDNARRRRSRPHRRRPRPRLSQVHEEVVQEGPKENRKSGQLGW